jgi:hypothetical protein
MNTLTLPRPHTTTVNQAFRRSPRTELRPRWRPNMQHISDAVVAGYILEISERHRRASAPTSSQTDPARSR